MYPSYEDEWYNYTSNEELSFPSSPYQPLNYYEPYPDERIFPSMPPFSGPPSGPPSGFPGGQQPPMGAPGQGGQSGPPASPPPSYVPAQTQALQAGALAVDPGSIRRCLFRYTYIWMRNRQQFWFYPIFLGRTSVAGWRWTGFSWVYFGISLRQIESFTCV